MKGGEDAGEGGLKEGDVVGAEGAGWVGDGEEVASLSEVGAGGVRDPGEGEAKSGEAAEDAADGAGAEGAGGGDDAEGSVGVEAGGAGGIEGVGPAAEEGVDGEGGGLEQGVPGGTEEGGFPVGGEGARGDSRAMHEVATP